MSEPSVDRDLLRARLRHVSCSDRAEDKSRRSDLGQTPAQEPIPAAVLVAVIGRPDGPTVILTRRTELLQNHAGEISLPGGRVEPHDAGSLATALREAAEELGLDITKVDILGCLPCYDTVSGFRVRPFVGWLEPPVALQPDEREVAEVFEVPLPYLLNPVNRRQEELVVRGKPYVSHVFEYEGRRIWGATAAILVGVTSFLARG